MRLKCIFFVLACLLCTNNIQSQDIMDTLAISACECLQEDIGDFETEEERNLQLGMCILKAIGPNGEKLYEFYGEDFILDGNTGEKLGQQIGFRMVSICPEVFAGFVEEELRQDAEKEATQAEEFLIGTVTKVESTQYVNFTVIDSNGKRQKLVWLYHFPNSDQYIDSYEELEGKDLMFNYSVEDVFDPRINEYTSVKIITGISDNE
jgi:hypothetical protein